MEAEDASNEVSVTAPLGRESTPNSSVSPLRDDSLQATDLIEESASKSTVSPLQADSPQPVLDVESQHASEVSEPLDSSLQVDSTSVLDYPQHSSEISELPGSSSQVDLKTVLVHPQHSSEVRRENPVLPSQVGSTPVTVDSQHSSGRNQTNPGGSSSRNIAACGAVAVQAATRIFIMATEANATCFCLVMTFLAGLLVLALSPIIWPKSFGL